MGTACVRRLPSLLSFRSNNAGLNQHGPESKCIEGPRAFGVIAVSTLHITKWVHSLD